MNDVMPALVLGCTCFLEVSAGIALLCFGWAALKLKPEPKTTVHTVGTTTTASTAVSAIVKLPALEPAPVEEEPEELIECGACHKLIKSQPVAQEENLETYRCESCGALVQVPL